jgi:uncharacterized protein (DUF1330 family)
MTAYVIARLHDVSMGDAIRCYLESIDSTLQPFGGRYIVHGGPKVELEGSWPGDTIILEFPDAGMARDWYSSDAYQAILSVRLNNSSGDIVLVEGVGPRHKAIDVLSR